MIKLIDLISEDYSSETLYGTPQNRSIQVSNEELRSFLTSKSNFVKYWRRGGKVIYRGNPKLDSNLSYKAFPSQYTRKSKNTKNYYTLIIDNLPSWNQYPKRSKSLVCSLSKHYAASYAFGNPHILIPIKNAKVGICSKADIWYSFSEFSPDNLNEDIDRLVKILYKISNEDDKFATTPTSWEELLNIFSYTDTVKDSLQNYKHELGRYFSIYLDKNETLYNFIEKLFDPASNDFDLISNYNKEHSKLDSYDDNEVWTDADCYLVSIEQMKQFSKGLL
jgi:hypothetical protein